MLGKAHMRTVLSLKSFLGSCTGGCASVALVDDGSVSDFVLRQSGTAPLCMPLSVSQFTLGRCGLVLSSENVS